MKKGALSLLLIFPFLIAFLAFTASDYLIKEVEQDIDDIVLPYEPLQPFGLKQGKVKLEAEAIYNDKYPVSAGNEIIFSVPEDQNIVRIDHEADGYYLVPLSEGQVEVTASTAKGNVMKKFTALVYGEAGSIVVALDHPFSTAGIGTTKYWGRYDIVYDSISSPYYKHDAVIGFSAYVVGNDAMDIRDFTFEHSDNLKVDFNDMQITVVGSGDSYIRFTHPFSTSTVPVEIAFKVVDAVNVYSYEDLIKATNLSETGEAVVLHTNLDSQENYDKLADKKGASVFGLVDGKVNPESYVYDFETTYNHDFAKWWNGNKDANYDIEITIHSGIRIRQSLYGNGFLINGHDLCYPSSYSTLEDGTIKPEFSADGNDLFRGPLVYASAGNPYTPYGTISSSVEPLLVIYGQDNSLLYVDGDDVLIDDLRLRNADFGNNYQNLFTAGTGIDVNGENVTISNSVVSSARTLIRSYSSSLTVDNCLLQNCLEFGIRTGANESNRVDYSKEVAYSDYKGVSKETTVSDYIAPLSLLDSDLASQLQNGKADSVLTDGILYNNQANVFVSGLLKSYVPRNSVDYDFLVDGSKVVQDALTNTYGFVDGDGEKNYFNALNVADCFFYNCHIAPIMVDSYSNSPFFENMTSTVFGVILGMYMDAYPAGLSRTMAPSLVNISGDNRFYTYQKVGDLSFDSLLYEDIDTFIGVHGGVSSIAPDVDEDDYLPLRELLGETDSLVSDGSESYIATPVMKMGGGTNLSDIVIDESIEAQLDYQSLNCYERTLTRSSTMVPDSEFMDSDEAKYTTMKVALSRGASNVLGFEDYGFYCYDPEQAPYFGETPSLSELSGRAA